MPQREEYLTQAEFGRRTGRTQQAVSKLVRAGKIPLRRRDGKKLIPFHHAQAALAENMDPAQAGNSPSAQGQASTGRATYTEVRTAQMALKVQDQQLELAKKRGQLIDRDEALRRAFEFARGFRDHMQNFPARYAALLAAETGADVQKLAIALERRLKEYLGDLADRRIGL